MWSARAGLWLFVLVLLMLLGRGSTRVGQTYATVLSSDSFLMGARVLGYALRRLNATRPLLILCTDDVSRSSIDRLELDGFIVRKTKPFHTPYKSTHTQTKFQYTKIRLWAHTDYVRMVHVDADCLPIDNIDELFECGDFCAVMRHSDMFNSGVFTLTPNEAIFQDMTRKMCTMESYDGGDQGFLNSYFSELKFSTMFNGTSSGSPQNEVFAHGVHRLSFFYNTDIGMYYLNSKFIKRPKIIHYTLGPVKPWIWWTYPLFDLNWQWLEVRDHIEATTGTAISIPFLQLMLLLFIFFIIFHALTNVLQRRKHLSILAPQVESTFAKTMTVAFIGIGTNVAYCFVPQQLHPYSAWLLFAVIQMSSILFLNSCYCTLLRLMTQVGGNSLPTCNQQMLQNRKEMAYAFAGYLALGFLLWWTTYSIANVNYRVLFAVFSCISSSVVLYTVCRRMQWKQMAGR